VEETFVAFNEEKPLVEKFADEKKHMVTGVVAIPNKPIYRRNKEGEEYDIVFSEQAIEKMAKDFLKEYRQKEVTLQHQEDADGVYLVEQWIKTDMVYDKSISVGLSRELPVGSWIQTYYVDSNDVWKRIEDGELQGFSLECMLGLEEFEEEFNKVQNDSEMDVNDETFWAKLKNVLSEAFGKKDENLSSEEELQEEINEQETVIVEEELEEAEKPVETPPVEPKVEEPTVVQEEPKQEPVEPANEPVEEQPKQEDNHLEDLINNLKAEIEALKDVNKGLTSKVKELGKTPSTKPVNTNAPVTGVKGDAYAQWRETMRELVK
jgi:outer membrane biosynthesis protein TonB